MNINKFINLEEDPNHRLKSYLKYQDEDQLISLLVEQEKKEKKERDKKSRQAADRKKKILGKTKSALK